MTETTRIMREGGNFRLSLTQETGKSFVTLEKGKRVILLLEVEPTIDKIKLAVLEYVVVSLRSVPRLLKFATEHNSTMKLANHLYRYKSKSQGSLKSYLYTIFMFCNHVRSNPDDLVRSCFNQDETINQKEVMKISRLIDDYLTEKEIDGKAGATLLVYSAHLKTFFQVNEIEMKVPRRFSNRVTYRDRAPRPEEVQKMIDIAPLREKAIIAMLATGGFRIGSLLGLRYKDLKEDLEAGRIPVQVNVPAEFNKGKVCEYDTFVNEEAARYVNLYLDTRRLGTRKVQPEEITDESPLFRAYSKEIRGLDSSVIRCELQALIKQAGLINDKAKRHGVRVHSLRKFFKTQLTALGVPSEFVEYWMGHKLSTYLDVQSKGIDFLRQVYASANLRIAQEKKASLADVLKEIIKARGEDPSRYLKGEAMPGRTVLSKEEEAEAYAHAIWELLRKEVVNAR